MAAGIKPSQRTPPEKNCSPLSSRRASRRKYPPAARISIQSSRLFPTGTAGHSACSENNRAAPGALPTRAAPPPAAARRRERARHFAPARDAGSRRCSRVTMCSAASKAPARERQRASDPRPRPGGCNPRPRRPPPGPRRSIAGARISARTALRPRRRPARARPTAEPRANAATASSISASKCRMCRRSGRGRRYASAEYLIALRASIITVEPARQAASSSVKRQRGSHQRQIAPGPWPAARRRFRARGARGAPWGRGRAPGWWPGRRDCRAAKNTCGAPPRSRTPPAALPDRGRGSRTGGGARPRRSSARPSRRNCQQAALGTCTTSRPSGASRTRAAAR